MTEREGLLLTPPGPGPAPDDLSARVAWWRAQEAAFVRNARPDVDVEEPGPPLPSGAHEEANAFLPIDALVPEVHGLLRAWFGDALDALGVDLAAGSLAAARSWLDARARVRSLARLTFPSELLARLGAAPGAHALVFELFDPPEHGAGLGRYPERLAALVAALAGRPGVRVWDVGCGTGEGTHELAYALARASAGTGVDVEAVGTTPWPLQRLMAGRRDLPHDPARAAATRAALGEPPPRCVVRFEVGDARVAAPAGTFDLVTCHGVLGGAVEAGADVEAVLGRVAGALAPGGLASFATRLRADRAARAARQVAEWAAREGLVVVEETLVRRPRGR